MPEGRRTPPRSDEERGITVGLIALIAKIIQWLLLSLFLAILVEWVGMTWWWEQAGVTHSREMFEAEQGFLGTEFRLTLVSSEPVRLGAAIGHRLSYVIFDLTRLNQLIKWANQTPSRDEPHLRALIHAMVNKLARYLIAAKQIVQVFGCRLAVLVLAMPVLGLCCVVALIEGLVRRDLRRWGGGRESGFIYHWAKRVALPLAVGVWLIYLMLPVSIHPSYIVLPFAGLLALATTAAAGTFKKYL